MEAGGLPVDGGFGEQDGWMLTGSATAADASGASGSAIVTTVMTTGYSGLVAKGEGKLTAPVILDQNPPRHL
jgi:hypothetical protein